MRTSNRNASWNGLKVENNNLCMVLNRRYINFWKVSVFYFFFFFEANLTKVERKQCTILNMYLHIHARSSCVQKKQETRSLDGEATQCTVGKHCGHMLNILASGIFSFSFYLGCYFFERLYHHLFFFVQQQ